MKVIVQRCNWLPSHVNPMGEEDGEDADDSDASYRSLSSRASMSNVYVHEHNVQSTKYSGR